MVPCVVLCIMPFFDRPHPGPVEDLAFVPTGIRVFGRGLCDQVRLIGRRHAVFISSTMSIGHLHRRLLSLQRMSLEFPSHPI